MACFHPVKCWRKRDADPVSGKHGITFNKAEGYEDLPITIPCQQCVGCRIDRSKEWAIRCHHEASLWSDNCFITLTYNAANLPRDLSCDYRVFQLFMKRLRKKYGKGIRFFHCGEYGEENGRPHYHALLFNHDFHDKVKWKESKGKIIYMSAELQELWPYGLCTTQDCTLASASYCARYIMKKVTGKPAEEHYSWTDPVSNITYDRKPEYCQMSLKPGLGLEWYRQFKDDIYPDDFVVIDGKKYKIPSYYQQQLEKEDEREAERILFRAKKKARAQAHNSTPERLAVRKKVTEARIAKNERSL